MDAATSRASVRVVVRNFAATLVRADRSRIALYVLLSLAAALAGSAVAVCLVPLVQPGQGLRVAGQVLVLPGGLPLQASLFVLVSLLFAVLRWQSARLAARLTSRYAIGLRQRVHASLLEAPLPALADASSAEIANVLTYNIEIATQGFSAVLQLLVAGITAVVSVCLALLIVPGLAAAAPVLLVLAWCGLRASGSAQQARISRDYVADMTRLFWLSEDFPRRLRHVRSFQREDVETGHYTRISDRLGQGYAQQQALVANSRLLLELTAVAAIAGILVVANLWQGADRAALITVSLLLGRLLPYLVSTRQSVQQLRSAWPALQLWRRYVALAAPRSESTRADASTLPAPLQIDRVTLLQPLSALQIPPGAGARADHPGGGAIGHRQEQPDGCAVGPDRAVAPAGTHGGPHAGVFRVPRTDPPQRLCGAGRTAMAAMRARLPEVGAARRVGGRHVGGACRCRPGCAAAARSARAGCADQWQRWPALRW